MKTLEKSPAEQLFRHFCEAYQARDLVSVLKLCTKDINMWGSGLDEHRVGLKQVEEQLKRDWRQSEKAMIQPLSFVPTPSDSLWAAALCEARVQIDGKEDIFEQLRGTIVIAKEEGSWKISHMHASFPDYRNPESGSFPLKKV